MVAQAAKAFSAGPQMRKLYRRLGNVTLSAIRKKEGLPQRYIDRSRSFLETIRSFDAIRDGSNLLEVGTGWVHWEATCIRLFYDANITLYDIWDNRLFDIFKSYFNEFGEVVDKSIGLSKDEHDRVHALLKEISSMKSFDELYQSFGFQYVVDPDGTLKCFQDQSFDVIFSCDVLEHVDKDIIPGYFEDIYRLLKPGGYSIHQVDIADHLSYYDPSVPKKNYLKYSDRTWNTFFESQVQYVNRIQRSEWLNLIQKAGLILEEEKSTFCDNDRIKVDAKYENLDKADLECTSMRIVHRKP